MSKETLERRNSDNAGLVVVAAMPINIGAWMIRECGLGTVEHSQSDQEAAKEKETIRHHVTSPVL
jgi:hypothetical protein